MRSTIILWEFDLNLPSEYLEAENARTKTINNSNNNNIDNRNKSAQ